MISLRRAAVFFGVSVFGAVAASCSDAITDPTAVRSAPSDGASHTLAGAPVIPTAVGTVSSSTNSSATVNARILLFKSGAAIIQFNTGTFSNATNSGTANGHFTSLTYTVFDGTRIVATRTITTDKTSGVFAEQVNLCTTTSSRDDSDDDDDGDGHSSCTAQYVASYTTVVNATITGVSNDPKKSYILALVASELYAPDIDLTNVPISIVGGGSSSTQLNAVTNTSTTYSVNFANTKPINGIAPAVGLQTTCVVTVNGMPQIPYFNTTGFSYVGSPTPFVAAGDTKQCKFTLKLPAGTYTVAVTALPGLPGDYDPTNNTTTVSLVVGAASNPAWPTVTFGVPALQTTTPLSSVVNSTTPLVVTAGTSPNFSSTVSATTTATATVAAGCSATLRNATSTLETVTGTLTLPPTIVQGTPASGTCTFKFSHSLTSAAGVASTPYTIDVTVNPVLNAINSTAATTSFAVNAVTQADLKAIGIVRLSAAGGSPVADQVAGLSVDVNTTGYFRVNAKNLELPGALASATCNVSKVEVANGGTGTYTILENPTTFTLDGGAQTTSSANGCEFAFTPTTAGAVFNVTVGFKRGQPLPAGVQDDSVVTVAITGAATFDFTAQSVGGSMAYTMNSDGVTIDHVSDQQILVNKLQMLLVKPNANTTPLGTFHLHTRVWSGRTLLIGDMPTANTTDEGPLAIASGIDQPCVTFNGTPVTTMVESNSLGGLVSNTTGGELAGFVCSKQAPDPAYQIIAVSFGASLNNQACVGTATWCQANQPGRTQVNPAVFVKTPTSTFPSVCVEFTLNYKLTGGTEVPATVAHTTFELRGPLSDGSYVFQAGAVAGNGGCPPG